MREWNRFIGLLRQEGFLPVQAMKRRWIQVAFVLALIVAVVGCGKTQGKTQKLRDLKFTVLSAEQLPEELKQMMEEKKTESFRLTFTDENILYICVGYGKQPTGGYSISVTELYETENAVYVHTNLLGPTAEEARQKSPSCPYIVMKLENLDKVVVFE